MATGRAERDCTVDLRGALVTAKSKHRAAITDPVELGRLLVAIEKFDGTPVVKAALKLTPMLFQRPGEIRTMEWKEIDWEQERWEIPVSKMKMGKPHIVPLSRQAIDILRDIHKETGRSSYVFPVGKKFSKPLSENGVRTALRNMGFGNEEVSPHGFRATARTILDEVLEFRVDLIEHQLAHAVKDPTGRAYNRTSHLPARKEMMQRWADYLDELKAKAAGQPVTDKALPLQPVSAQAIPANEVVSPIADPVNKAIVGSGQVEEPKPVHWQLEDQVSTRAEVVPTQESPVPGNSLADSLKFLFDDQKARFEKERQEKEAELAEEKRKREARAAWEKLPPSERHTPLADMIAKGLGPIFDGHKAVVEKSRLEKKEALEKEEKRQREVRAEWDKLHGSEPYTPLADMIARTFGPKGSAKGQDAL